jgi:hypothetical protein
MYQLIRQPGLSPARQFEIAFLDAGVEHVLHVRLIDTSLSRADPQPRVTGAQSLTLLPKPHACRPFTDQSTASGNHPDIEVTQPPSSPNSAVDKRPVGGSIRNPPSELSVLCQSEAIRI